MSKFTAQQIAGLLGGTVEGDANAIVTKLSKIEEGIPESISFLSNPVYTPYIYTTDASIVIVASDLMLEKPVKSTCTLVRVADPRASFAVLLEAYNQLKDNRTGIEQPSFISPTATIGKNVYVGAFAYIGDNVTIGDNSKIYPNAYIGNNTVIGSNTLVLAGVKIHHECVIGNNCTFHSGVIIGGDGFGFTPNSENNYKKIPQIGNVIIEDYVDVGSNTTIDRATLGSTIIRKGVKLDNLIQIGHNVEIGENTIIVAQTGIAGSTKIGKNCIIAGQVGIVGHITIADGTKVAAQSGVGNSIVEQNQTVQGSPAFGIGDYKRSYVMFRNLPDLSSKLKDIEKLIKEK
ncbi:MAG: UDP-3-O-(3-hydroxymyristoyl) glucosamine N-acyltransferase [Bacteroidetes bacterium]|nr:UDP-3-O-(3-hydroxymyristoyl) glucosamine N-acyltransferase [Bacteroidota bacterium]